MQARKLGPFFAALVSPAPAADKYDQIIGLVFQANLTSNSSGRTLCSKCLRVSAELRLGGVFIGNMYDGFYRVKQSCGGLPMTGKAFLTRMMRALR